MMSEISNNNNIRVRVSKVIIQQGESICEDNQEDQTI